MIINDFVYPQFRKVLEDELEEFMRKNPNLTTSY